MSNIQFDVINGDYPVAGQDNDTQGFRDNFGNIKTALSVTKNEINLLQDNAVLKATVDGENDPVTNNMGGSTISNGILTQMATGTIAGVIAADTINVNSSTAGFYYATVNADTTLQFTGWPTWATAGTPACISVKVFIKAGTSGTTNRIITVAAGANTIKCDSSTAWTTSATTFTLNGTTKKYKLIEAFSYDGGINVYVRFLGEF
jgi:hypothetical protein